MFWALLPPFFSQCFVFPSAPKHTKIRFCKTTSTILPLVLHGCATCFLILREESRLGLFKNKALKKILGLQEVGSTKLLKKTAQRRDSLCSFPNIIRVIRSRRIKFVWNVTRMKENENSQRRKPEAIRVFGKFKRSCEERTEGYRMGMCGLDHLAWDKDKRQTLARGK